MPENEAPIRALYDHEIDEPRATGRRRRQVADWGVGEDVFDRLPSRRFARAERRGEEHHRAPRTDEPPHRDDFARGEATDATRRDDFARGEAPPAARRDDSEPRRPRRRPAADWLEEVSPRPAAEPEATRTIVIGGAVEDEIAPPGDHPAEDQLAAAPLDEAPRPRRTIVIGGHPDKLPAPRPRRPPRTALERVGASPDRLAAYAVGLGLLLILIAVLTTSH
jgi:hypothetical protein